MSTIGIKSDVPSRHEVAKELGRRVSKGEYERIFGRLFPKQLKTVKKGWKLGEDGKPERTMYHPIVAQRHPDSPKALRKKASR